MKNAAECDVCQRHKSETVPTRSLSSTIFHMMLGLAYQWTSLTAFDLLREKLQSLWL